MSNFIILALALFVLVAITLGVLYYQESQDQKKGPSHHEGDEP